MKDPIGDATAILMYLKSGWFCTSQGCPTLLLIGRWVVDWRYRDFLGKKTVFLFQLTQDSTTSAQDLALYNL